MDPNTSQTVEDSVNFQKTLKNIVDTMQECTAIDVDMEETEKQVETLRKQLAAASRKKKTMDNKRIEKRKRVHDMMQESESSINAKKEKYKEIAAGGGIEAILQRRSDLATTLEEKKQHYEEHKKAYKETRKAIQEMDTDINFYNLFMSFERLSGPAGESGAAGASEAEVGRRMTCPRW
jgi:chromosome segregation ATPase